MTYLSRLVPLGLAKEGTQWTYQAPTISVPFNSGAKFTDNIAPLRDESYRANDVILQGLNQGPWNTAWDVPCNGYADLLGYFLRAIIGPDTYTAGISTTLSSASLAGAASISTAASIPYTIPISTPSTGLLYAHNSAVAVVSQATHLFQQNRTFSTVWPTYSWTVGDGPDILGYPGNVFSELAIKIDPKGYVTLGPKSTGFPSATQSSFAYAASAVQPVVGWSWTVTNGGASSTRGLTFDVTFKRAVEVIHSSDGLQAPREIFPGALEADGTYKAIFENDLDISLFKQYIQSPTVHTLTQPVQSGGAVLAITMSKSGYTTGEVDLSSTYVQLNQAVSGIGNTTDAGVTQVSLMNFVASQY
jgi:hypothetical protein